MDNQISRRSFLAGASALGIAGIGAGLVGCSSGNAEEASASESGIPATWDAEHDVIVVGGACGMVAAIEAAEAGADVVVLEKADHTGGLWMAAGGELTMGGNNVVQQAAGVKDDNDSWYEDEMYASEYRAVPEIIRTLVDNGAETVQWMTDLGMIWGELTAGQLRGDTQRGLKADQNPGVYVGGNGTPNSGISWTQLWEKKLDELGVPRLLNHKMTKIYREPDGAVVGVEVETEEGAKSFKAHKGVVLATGGWTDNERMVAAWDPRIVGEDCYGDGGVPSDGTHFVQSTGDGHIAASDIGAMFADMSFVSFLNMFFGSRSYWGWGEDPDWTTNEEYARGRGIVRNADTYQKCILVDGAGKRYVNESTATNTGLPKKGRGGLAENPYLPFNEAYLALVRPRNVWLIADATIAADLKWPLEQIEKPNPKTGFMFDSELIAIADTIEDLAKQMGVPASELNATIAIYNGYADAGVDGEFGKAAPLSKIATPPFYGLKASLVRHTCRNGIRVNTKSQVIDGRVRPDNPLAAYTSIDDEPVIQGLYACGECGNSLGNRRIHNTLGHYTTTARIAGQNVAAEPSA